MTEEPNSLKHLRELRLYWVEKLGTYFSATAKEIARAKIAEYDEKIAKLEQDKSYKSN